MEKQDQETVANLTLRQRTELHRTNAVCANCHKTLDPIGFGLENFDAIGRWRDQDENGGAIDAAGELPGWKAFFQPQRIEGHHRRTRSMIFPATSSERLLAYALCSRLEGYDEIVVDDLMQDIAADGYRMQTLITAVVTSYPFTHRRIQEEADSPNDEERLINRRTCLQGIGASLALPLLETMGWADTIEGKTYKPPVRLGFMYMPHGVIMDQFWPADAESFLSSPPPALESLRPVLDQCLLMKGISGVPISPFNGAPHALELSTWLTATLPNPDKRNEINIAISADQIAANYVGAFTTLPSLELATMPQTQKENQEGLNEAYYSHCSFRSPTQPVPAEINPRNVLNRLFNKKEQQARGGGSSQMSPLDRQMLDLVLGGARDCGEHCRQPTSRNWMNIWTVCARWNDALPPSNPARKRRLWRKRASAPANATTPIRRRSKSRSPRATSAASTCR